MTLTGLTIVDTDVLIDAGRGDVRAVDFLGRLRQQALPAVSAVTQMELFVGCRNKVELA